MPYTEKQERLLQAIKRGFKPKEAMKGVTPGRAAEMLSHGAKKRKKKMSAAEALSRKTNVNVKPVRTSTEAEREAFTKSRIKNQIMAVRG